MSNPDASTASHAADQAGGEVVFSSDGLEPLAPVKPPAFVKQDVYEDEVGDVHNAFGVFGVRPAEETSLEKLERLQREVRELQKASQLKNAEDSIPMEDITALQSALEKIDLTAPTVLKPAKNIPSVTAAADDDSSDKKESLQHQLQERILHLETALGCSTASTPSSNPQQSLTQRLQQMETLHSQLSDPTELWQRKAKTVRQDLEAAAKARNKLLLHSSSSNQQQHSQTNKTLTELYNLSQQLGGFGSAQLAALAQRLEALSHLHTQSATYQARLATLEQALPQKQAALAQLEETLRTLETSVTQSSQQMQANAQVLQEQIQKLQE